MTNPDPTLPLLRGAYGDALLEARRRINALTNLPDTVTLEDRRRTRKAAVRATIILLDAANAWMKAEADQHAAEAAAPDAGQPPIADVARAAGERAARGFNTPAMDEAVKALESQVAEHERAMQGERAAIRRMTHPEPTPEDTMRLIEQAHKQPQRPAPQRGTWPRRAS